MNTQTITNEIKEGLKDFFWTDEKGRVRVSLGNCRLDFQQHYFFEKFTNKGVKLYWLNGGEKVFVMGKVEYNETHKDYIFYTEGKSYMEHFGRNKEDKGESE